MIGAIANIAGAASEIAGVDRSTQAGQGGAGAQVGGANFAAVLGDAMAGVADGVRAAEASALSALDGSGTMQDAVNHIMTAERQLQQAIAVRDKLVSGYMDLTRMQI
jgi:flagellar hook-basal body complex protein FliE